MTRVRNHLIHLLLSLTIIFWGAVPAAAQDSTIPYVTSIDVTAGTETVKVSWQPASPEPDHYVILRSPAPINSDTYPGKTERCASVPAGSTSHTLSPPDGAPYYYAVLSARKDGSVHTLFIPYRNVTAQPVALSGTTLPENTAQIREITAEPGQDSISVRIRTDKPQRPILLYRSTAPILSADDIVQANLIASIGEGKTSYTDFPLAGVDYYYAAIDARLAEAGSYRFAEGENSTAQSVRLPISRAAGKTPAAFAARETTRGSAAPLPFFQFSRSIISGESLTPPSFEERTPVSLSQDTRAELEELMKTLPPLKPAELQPEVLAADRDEPRGNDEQMLDSILNGPFAERDWKGAEKRLGQLLSTRIGESIERRAHFYLAQAYFFQQEYTAAFFEFVLLEDSMYETVRPWMYRILEMRQEG
jgi:hypothetical protein